MAAPVYILGGWQSDFADNWARRDADLMSEFQRTIGHGLEATRLEPEQIQCAHVGNFAAELFCNQGHLGGFFAAAHPAFAGLPCARHEAACASGSIAALAAGAEIEAGRYDLIAVLGIEQMRNVPGLTAANYIGGPAMWSGHECQDVDFPWPHIFSELVEEYDRRYGIDVAHLRAIARNNFANARRNPNAQTRRWTLTDAHFSDDPQHNPVIEGHTRKHDCGQITDGAAVVFLAGPETARNYARDRGVSLADLPVIKGWGHRTAPISWRAKLALGAESDYVFPHVRGAIEDAFGRAGVGDVAQLSGIETHDCFTSTEYMAIDHFGITPPGQSWQAIETGRIALDGELPVNASGGLIGLGHPVGATGVRMLLDCARQVTGTAGDCQIEGAHTMASLNIGGSATTTVSFVVGRGAGH
ncbi:MAG: acetyl-CoA acetyltransferase [Pseudomonadota bacterium]